MPGIGLIKRRLETEAQAIALATSHIIKEYGIATATASDTIDTLETKYDTDAGDWYVALGWNNNERRVVVRMDSILGKVIETKEI